MTNRRQFSISMDYHDGNICVRGNWQTLTGYRSNRRILPMTSQEFITRLKRWQTELVQDAFDNLNEDERDWLLSGIASDPSVLLR